MENMNAAVLYGGYGDKGGIGGAGLGSIMGLVTEQDQGRDQKVSAGSDQGMITTMTNPPPPLLQPPPSSHSSYTHNHVNGLISAATMFHGGQDSLLSHGHNHHHHSKHHVGCHFQSGQLGMNHMEVDRTFAGKDHSERRLRASCQPEPSFVVRSVSQLGYQQQEKEAMGTSHEVETASSTAPNMPSIDLFKTKIAGHPDYPRLMAASMDCRKTGAPADVVSALEEISEERQLERHTPTMSIGEDPELGQFKEAYCEMLRRHQAEFAKSYKEGMEFINKNKAQLSSLNISVIGNSYCEMLRRHQAELAKSHKEGMEFINKNKAQLSSLNISVIGNSSPGYSYERCGSSEEELSCGEAEVNENDPGAQEKKLKDQLLQKCSGCSSTLKKEFLKKRKKGKHPKEGKQKLLEWWHSHSEWPYPLETDKIALAQSTGLDKKQVNYWFINQRKRQRDINGAFKFV